MIIDQSEIDQLLDEADSLAATAAEQAAASEAPPPPPPPPPPAVSPAIRRVLRLRVPVIVQLARRTMPIASVRDLSIGSIIEFEKSVDDQLDLMINNQPIGLGNCVKVGENFGLRVTEIASRRARIESLTG
jgi:flagellar motor switch protein FliN/FliY